jgi:antitoxin Phd
MNINVENLVSVPEANRNFSRVARLVDENGTAIILKNNAPRYVLLDYCLFRQDTVADRENADAAASRIIEKQKIKEPNGSFILRIFAPTRCARAIILSGRYSPPPPRRV